MDGKDIYIPLMLALVCWPRPVASLVTLYLASLATPRHFIDDTLLTLLGLTTETRPTHNRDHAGLHESFLGDKDMYDHRWRMQRPYTG